MKLIYIYKYESNKGLSFLKVFFSVKICYINCWCLYLSQQHIKIYIIYNKKDENHNKLNVNYPNNLIIQITIIGSSV